MKLKNGIQATFLLLLTLAALLPLTCSDTEVYNPANPFSEDFTLGQALFCTLGPTLCGNPKEHVPTVLVNEPDGFT